MLSGGAWDQSIVERITTVKFVLHSTHFINASISPIEINLFDYPHQAFY